MSRMAIMQGLLSTPYLKNLSEIEIFRVSAAVCANRDFKCVDPVEILFDSSVRDKIEIKIAETCCMD